MKSSGSPCTATNSFYVSELKLCEVYIHPQSTTKMVLAIVADW